jgi:hypothetical protein
MSWLKFGTRIKLKNHSPCPLGNICCENFYKDIKDEPYCINDITIPIRGIEVCPIPSKKSEVKFKGSLKAVENREKKLKEWFEMGDRDRWSEYKKMKRVAWVCGVCGEPDPDKPRRGGCFEGDGYTCDYCGSVLTERTPGGQSDPFNWVPKKYLK